MRGSSGGWTPSLENHNFDRFLWKLAFGRPPPPTWKKVGPPPSKPRKCWTPSGTLENYSFPNNKPSDPSVKLLNKYKVRTKRTAKKKKPQKRCPRFVLSGGPGPPDPPSSPPPPLGKNSRIRACRRNIISHLIRICLCPLYLKSPPFYSTTAFYLFFMLS